jgi:hypothetical protein
MTIRDRACALRGGLLLSLALALLPSCRDRVEGSAGARPTPSASAAPAPALLPPLATNLPSWPVPGGIPLPIERGKGVGPIRFGARLDTVERLMGDPCDVKVPLGPGEPRLAADGAPVGVAPGAAGAAGAGATPSDVLCRYAARAVEFELRGGVLTRIHVHRPARPFDADHGFGVYNGRFSDGAALGMYPHAAQESLGKPKRIEPRDGAPPYHTVEVHEYPGMELEYDRLPNGNVVLGGVVLEKG